MGRRKRHRPRREPRSAPPKSATLDPEATFALELEDDAPEAPHPLEDVANAMDTKPVEVATAQEPATPQAPPQADASTDNSDAETPDGGGDGGDVQTLGELLQQARESRGLSLEETCARTRISLKMLGHLEHDRFGEFAANAYAKGFLRNYGSFLGLDVDMLVRRYEAVSGHVTPAPAVWEEVVEPPRVRKRWRPSRRLVTGVAVVLLVAALAWVFWSRGAATLGLRPTRGLQQIENQLRAAPEPRRFETGLEHGFGAQAPQAARGKATATGSVDGEADASSDSQPEAPTAGEPTRPDAAPKRTPSAAKPVATQAAPPKPAPTKPAPTKPAATKPAPVAQKPPPQPPAPKPTAPQNSVAPPRRETQRPPQPAPPKRTTPPTTRPAAPKPEDTQPPKPQPKPPESRDPSRQPPPPPPEPSDPPH